MVWSILEKKKVRSCFLRSICRSRLDLLEAIGLGIGHEKTCRFQLCCDYKSSGSLGYSVDPKFDCIILKIELDFQDLCNFDYLAFSLV